MPRTAPTRDLSPAQMDRAADLYARLRDGIPENVRYLINRELDARFVDPRMATLAEAWEQVWPVVILTGPFNGSGELMPTPEKRAEAARLGARMREALAFWGDGSGRHDLDPDEIDLTWRGEETDRYMVQGAAIAMRARATRSPTPLADLADRPPREAIRRLGREFGWGWGEARCYDLLARFGLTLSRGWYVREVARDLGLTEVTDGSYLQLTDRARDLLGRFGPAGPREMRGFGLELAWTGRLESQRSWWKAELARETGMDRGVLEEAREPDLEDPDPFP